ncbi:MAG: transcription initiation factor IIB [Caldisphaeraceae archaeon]|nr:transcription initiation factor IIB [Caldisphaeraceae archaeon]MEB3692323.1 transcription initiation factor IIB [Caldisphaeraceae archaeon]MEB3798254.1 transcription initiation factor IIB [Caldisphaeraceae archaeon]
MVDIEDSGKNGSKPKKAECPPDKIIYDANMGARICLETGEVLEEQVIGDEAEWRAYTPDEKARRTRVGGPISLSRPNMGVDIYIGSFHEGSGKKIRGLSKRIDMLRLQRSFRMGRTLSSLEKNINQALKILDDLSTHMELSNKVREEASKMYRDATQKGLTRGRSIESVVAATLYAACRKLRIPCTIDEIAKHISAKDNDVKREIARCYRLLVRDLDVEIPVIEPELFVNRIVSALGLPDYVTVEAIKILRDAKGKGTTAGKDPSGLAAAAVYLAALKHGLRRTQKEVAHVAGVTEVTVRNRYKEIAGESGNKLP